MSPTSLALPPGSDVLTIAGLSKTFGQGASAVQANKSVDLIARSGQVTCLLGHNGAGKSTIVNQVVGIAAPDSGSITLTTRDGSPVNAIAHPARARELTSVQAQANVPITGLTPRKAINLVGRIRGARRRDMEPRTDHILRSLDMEEWADKPSQKVSGGVARLTAVAMALAVPGQLVVLDEPTNDVDPVRRRHLWRLIRETADAGAAVLVVTHNVVEAQSVVDNIYLLDAGSVIAQGSPAEIIALAQAQNDGHVANLEDAYVSLVG